ncbi:MAG: 2-oxoglutarate synthase subunit KorB [Euryarchaeota archaeon ADurb.BinA087]|nr:MAG: 2-oxoglutarate synthase subunit KorB [Euryarchaeota archaeon ADurb.BinA087]HPX73153.1 thiamine pyrophosphate-dependent enzyme [Methanoregulaceae archaeon]
MQEKNLITGAQNTWCPGCGNFTIQFALRNAIRGLVSEGVPLENIVLVTGIGCHAKMSDYLGINSFYSIHGRTIPVATGIKLANPELTVICCAGDGDAYAEGLDHLIFGAKRNTDITVVIHNNRVYGLTTGQYTPTSPFGFRGKSTPQGAPEEPFNPLTLMLASGAGFVARSTSRKMPHLTGIIGQALRHKGFSFVDVLQICASYFNVSELYDRQGYELSGHDPSDFTAACRKAEEWDYNTDSPIAFGLFYQEAKPCFEERFSRHPVSNVHPEEQIRAFLEKKR